MRAAYFAMTLALLTFIRPADAAEAYAATGIASWYGDWHQGKPTASGAPFDKNALTAAHRTYPIGGKLKVTNLSNRRSIVVTVIDRGPIDERRVIDLSARAAAQLGFQRRGLARVRIASVPD